MYFTSKIEDMNDEQLAQRIKESYNAMLPKIYAMPYIGDNIEVVYRSDELTALCPMTGIQDLYSITIRLIPDKYVPELKSLKFYFLAFRDLPISHEHLASRIKTDILKYLEPQVCSIKLDVAVRGGIKTEVYI